MKENVDIYTMCVGFISAVLKGIKKNLKLKSILISAFSGALLALGTFGVVLYFLEDLDLRMAIFISFIVGWIASDITDTLENVVDDAYEIFKAYVQSKKKK